MIRDLTNIYGVNEMVKLPIKVSALVWTGFNVAEMEDFTGVANITRGNPFTIPNSRGDQTCSVNEIVIQSVKGDMYPCSKETMEKIYRKVVKV